MQWRRLDDELAHAPCDGCGGDCVTTLCHVSAKPALTDARKAARLAWCREHVRDSVKSLVFMDEMGVWIDYHKQVYWIKPGEPRPIKELDSVQARLNVWGAR